MKKLKRVSLQLSVFLFVLIFLSCSKEDEFRGSGNIISQIRDVAGFSKVENSTSISVFIAKGIEQRSEVSADDNIINSVKTVVENGVLKVDLSNGNYVDVTITVFLTIPDLEVIENTGSGNMTVSGFEDLDNLEIDNEGSGSITLNGSGTSLTLKNSGSGNFKGFDFSTQNCTVANTGAGNCEINCTQALNGTNSGSGSVFYKGGSTVDIVNTGSGQIVDSN